MLGFSIGGMVAQEIALQAPDLVRKLILVGTGPRGGEGMASLTQVAKRIFGAPYDPPEHLWLAVLFSPSEAAQAAGKEFLADVIACLSPDSACWITGARVLVDVGLRL